MTLKDEKPAYPVVATGTEIYIQRSDIFSFLLRDVAQRINWVVNVRVRECSACKTRNMEMYLPQHLSPVVTGYYIH